MSELPKPNISLSTPDNTDVCLTDPSPAYPKLFALDAEDGYTYNWSKNYIDIGVTTNTYIPTDIGLYFVSVVDAFGCNNSSDGIGVYDVCDPINPPAPDTISFALLQP
ncbi:MAG: hypothetical protein IPO92_16940 [Saprospiraceae bacterium]|nr:hypothetical protein [Saprospiraceae bacterium]